jgi:4-hydroxy-3-methylbut-2-en-1-yl diphosphate synthase IspG/GcpE
MKGIGDTIRVSLSADPVEEVKVEEVVAEKQPVKKKKTLLQRLKND